MVLSKFSEHVPECGECLHCKFKNDCLSGELCIITNEQAARIERQRKFYQERYQRRKREKREKQNGTN